MSADNMIVILETEGPEYRIAHVQVPDFYMQADLSDPITQADFVETFTPSPVFTDKTKAFEYAQDLEEQLTYVEYGVGLVNYASYSFHKFMSYEFAVRLLDRECRECEQS